MPADSIGPRINVSVGMPLGTRVTVFYSDGFNARCLKNALLVRVEFEYALNPFLVLRLQQGDEVRIAASACSKIEPSREGSP